MRFLPHRKYIAAFHDAGMAALSFVLAFYLRLADTTWSHTQAFLIPATLIFTIVCVCIFIRMRLYRGLWRYASMQDLIMITKAVTLAILIFYPLLFLATRLEGVPRSVPVINWLLLLAMLGGPRFLYRMWKDRKLGLPFSLTEEQTIPVLLIGATDTAELFLRHTGNKASGYKVVGIVDDNKNRIGRYMHTVRIYGGLTQLTAIVNKLARKGTRPQRVILTEDQADGAKVRQLFETCEALGVPLARLPRLTEFKAGISERLEIQPIAVEDLLGRAQTTLNREQMQKLIAGKVVMVTGAGGTIGSELVRQVAKYHPSKLVMFELSEFLLYQIDQEMRETFPALQLSSILGDVRDAANVDAVMGEHRPNIVFHAAAIKHVPIAEANPEEAVLTNLSGTMHVADCCRKHNTDVMVLISTDKAVNPANVMGATKKLAENYCQALDEQGSGTRFITVRFGNVLGSTGSVVPLFQKQLARGGPLTVTHPDMVRYFMTVREAVELVIQAAALGREMQDKRGLIFVLDMGQAVRIQDLAIQMIKLAGLRPEIDIQIVYSGIRPGEKLFEELFYNAEEAIKTSHASIMLAFTRPVNLSNLQAELSELITACRQRQSKEILTLLKKLVPEYAAFLQAA